MNGPTTIRRFAIAVALCIPLLTSALGVPGSSQTGAGHKTADLCAAVNLSKAPGAPVPIRYGESGGGEEPLAMLWADKAKYPNNGRLYALEPTVYMSSDRITALQADQIDAGTISFPALVAAVNAGIGFAPSRRSRR